MFQRVGNIYSGPFEKGIYSFGILLVSDKERNRTVGRSRITINNYSQSVRWSMRPASQCVRRLVKASDVIGKCVRCGWSKCPRSLVNATGTNNVLIRLSELINYMN